MALKYIMAVRRKGKLLSRKRMRLAGMINLWRRFVSGKERYQARILRKRVEPEDL